MQSSILDITHDLQTALSGAADQLTTTPSLTATELATVMGTRLLAEQPTVAQLEEALRGVTDLPHCQNKPEIYLAIAEHLQTAIKAALERAAGTAAATAADRLAMPASSSAQGANSSIADGQEALAKLVSRIGEVDTSLPATRIETINKFNSSLRLVLEVIKSVEKHDDTIKTISVKLDALYDNPDCINTEVREEIKELQKLRSNIESERTHKMKKILHHFSESLLSSSDKAVKELTIPTQLEKGKGQDLIDNMYAYLKNRADEYYVILPYLTRISEDYDPATGSFYKPPNKLNNYNGVDPALLSLYIKQAQSLYTEINRRTPKELMAMIKSTFKYGLHEQLTGKCAEHDGPMAYFSLLSLFRPSSAAYRDELIEKFNQAFTYFAKGDPRKHINNLRNPLVEVIKLQIPLTWSTTGKKIVGVLSRRDHILSDAIKRYEAGPDKPEEAAIYLQELFSTIGIECDKITRLGDKVLEDTSWHAHSALTSNGNSTVNVECRYGDKCRKRACRFKHSGRDRTNKRQRESDTSSRGGQGRSKPICQAKDCLEKAPKDKRFCTTCFMKGRKSGHIVQKDGNTFKVKSVKHNNDKGSDNKTLFGFSAEQRQGLKLMREAELTAAEKESPAPASIKRQRVHERLGELYEDRQANARTARAYNNQHNINQFLSELYEGSTRQNDLLNQQ